MQQHLVPVDNGSLDSKDKWPCVRLAHAVLQVGESAVRRGESSEAARVKSVASMCVLWSHEWCCCCCQPRMKDHFVTILHVTSANGIRSKDTILAPAFSTDTTQSMHVINECVQQASQECHHAWYVHECPFCTTTPCSTMVTHGGTFKQAKVTDDNIKPSIMLNQQVWLSSCWDKRIMAAA